MKKIIKLGLVNGRHDMPVDRYVLENVPDVTDMDGINKAVEASLASICEDGNTELHLYVTGLTSVALATVGYCAKHNISVVAHHFNRDTGDYLTQGVL
jgi:hypothetical protein